MRLKWTGLDDWLKEQKGPVTKQQVLDFLKANQVEVQEVEHGGYLAEIDKLDQRIRELSHWPEDAAKAKRPEDQAELDRLNAQWETADKENPPTKFNRPNLVIPGGENYREVLLTLPEDANAAHAARSARIKQLIERRDALQAQPASEERRRDLANTEVQIDLAMKDRTPAGYRSSHWDEPNVIAHLRLNDRAAPDGKKVLMVEEIQSDWHQTGRTQGYRQPVPAGSKLVTDSNGRILAATDDAADAKRISDRREEAGALDGWTAIAGTECARSPRLNPEHLPLPSPRHGTSSPSVERCVMRLKTDRPVGVDHGRAAGGAVRPEQPS